jgi:signal transduction histidine kinase
VAAVRSLRGIWPSFVQDDWGIPLTGVLRREEPPAPSASRRALLGDLAALIGHEINNPLTFVMANLEILEEKLRAAPALDREEMQDLVADALAGADRIRRVVKQFQRVALEEDGPAVGPGPVAG